MPGQEVAPIVESSPEFTPADSTWLEAHGIAPEVDLSAQDSPRVHDIDGTVELQDGEGADFHASRLPREVAGAALQGPMSRIETHPITAQGEALGLGRVIQALRTEELRRSSARLDFDLAG